MLENLSDCDYNNLYRITSKEEGKRMEKDNRQRKKSLRKIVRIAFCSMLIGTISMMPIKAKEIPVETKEKKTVICIDAGHGGETDGATYTYDEITVYEKDLNLNIAFRLEEELEKYENVEVIQTRTEDTTVELKERVQFAAEQNADYLISIHNNAKANPEGNPKGCMVLVTQSHYQPKEAKVSDIYEVSDQLGLSIVKSLQELGLLLGNELGADSNYGLVKRPYSPEGGARKTRYYPDGSVLDYYALIRYGVEKGIPSIIIEHAYLSNEEDYREYLATEEALQNLAKADAQGIADALGLKEKVVEENTFEETALEENHLQK